MSMLKLCYNQNNEGVVFVPFGRDMVGNVATGPLQILSKNDFLEAGANIAQRYIDEYYTRDSSIRSELYQEFSSQDRKKFFSTHSCCNITVSKDAQNATVYFGAELCYSEEISYPFRSDSFATEIIRILSSSG